MNKDIMRSMGFEKEVELVEGGECPMCRKPISPNEFRDDLSRKEFRISGMCQTCQDETFDE